MDHHITHMDADAKPELPVLRNPLVLLPQPLLYLHRTLNRLDHTRELREHTVSRRVGYAAPVLAYEAVHDFSVSRERPQRRHFVLTHKTRVSRHVGREDGCELPFDWRRIRAWLVMVGHLQVIRGGEWDQAFSGLAFS